MNGWLSANDIRRMENMDPVENGDIYLVPLNMVPADQIARLPQAGLPPKPAASAMKPAGSPRPWPSARPQPGRGRAQAIFLYQAAEEARGAGGQGRWPRGAQAPGGGSRDAFLVSLEEFYAALPEEILTGSSRCS